jgi:hypothetical protein
LLGAAPAGAGPSGDEERLAIALAAYKAGFFLVETIDLAVDPQLLASELGRLRALARRMDADALFVYGGEPGIVLEEVAADLRLSIRRVSAPALPHIHDAGLGRERMKRLRLARRAAVIARARSLLGHLSAT